ncbi:MAG: hypothetical protein HZB68_03070 [Candidatus Aenigmarchaeota archaeon]|nr:hypothetical protein [Candidatus Aenigmarchaeota archaeon]
MNQEKKEIEILNISFKEYCDNISKKDPSCYELIGVFGSAQGNSYSDEDFKGLVERAEKSLRGSASERGVDVIVNAEYSHSGCGSQYSGYTAVLVNGIALKDKEG